VGVSIGASQRGYRPVAEMQFADFISCGFDQIVNQAATLRYRTGGRVACPIVVRAPSGGNVGGGLYHSQNPEAWFIHRPGLKVVAPSNAWDAKGLLKAAIRDDNPVIYMEHKYLYRRAKGPVPEGDEIVPIGVAATRRDLVELLQVRAGESHVELHWEPAGDLPDSTFDPEGIHRAVLNIVINAIDAAEGADHAMVRIATGYDPNSDFLWVRVTDNGPGIPEEVRDRIFEPFVTGRAGGTGLGLSVSLGIAERHGGKILVESEVGKGTTFTLCLPLSRERSLVERVS